MIFFRFITLLILPALLWSTLPARDAAACSDFSPAKQTNIAKPKIQQLGAIARDNESRSVSIPSFRPLETPLERFSEPVLAPGLSARQSKRAPKSHLSHRAPSLTGVVELLI